MAEQRLTNGDYPETLKNFSEQLARELKQNEPEAAPMTAKTIRNAIRELWRIWPKSPK
jgi:hypothetical protein